MRIIPSPTPSSKLPTVESVVVIIDTSAWIDFFRRDGDLGTKLAVKGLLDAFAGALCGPVEMEFLGGARPSERAAIQSWFGLIPYFTNDQKIWRKAASHFAKLRTKGHTIPWNDLLIATIALENGSAVFAHDRHFDVMSEHLGLRLYRPGYDGTFNPEG